MNDEQLHNEQTRIIEGQKNLIIQRIYYLIGLAVASTGFMIDKTWNMKGTFEILIPSCCVICWALSVIVGLKFLEITTRLHTMHNAAINAMRSKDERSWVKISAEIDSLGDRNSTYGNLTFTFYIVGVIIFVLWHFGKKIFLLF